MAGLVVTEPGPQATMAINTAPKKIDIRFIVLSL
jgi:hypothetical protein